MSEVIQALRGLLLGGPVGNHGWLAVAWCAGIALAGYLWAQSAFNRRAAR
jgi:ABC-2 type transport system permease protein